MSNTTYEVMHKQGSFPVKSWTKGVPFEEDAKRQLRNIASMPFIHRWVAAMPDVHLGKGATIGSVIPTIGAVIPAAVGVDIGCGMMAVKTSMKADQLTDNLKGVRSAIEKTVPHGMSKRRRGDRDKGSWEHLPEDVMAAWKPLHVQFEVLKEKHPLLKNTNNINHLGTLGSGNHFIEVCLDDENDVWIMLHMRMEVAGQEILTKDKVNLRINLSCSYQFKDVLTVTSQLPNPVDYIYRELQFGLRAAVGTRTLDALLEDKGVIDESVTA